MRTLTLEDLTRQSQRLLDDAARSEVLLVLHEGQNLLHAVPPGDELGTADARLELAARLLDHEQISQGPATRLANLSYGEIVDELVRLRISVILTTAGELQGDLAAFGS